MPVITYNGWGISEVPDRKGGNLDEAIAKSDMHLLADPNGVRARCEAPQSLGASIILIPPQNLLRQLWVVNLRFLLSRFPSI